MRTRARVISLLALLGSTLGPLVALGESPPPRAGAAERSPWSAIAELRREVQSLRLQLDRACRPPSHAGDLVTQRLAVGGSVFAVDPAIAPKLIVHDESRETATLASLKYSDGFANHLVQGRARGSLAAPADVRDNDVVAQYAGHGYRAGAFEKVGAVDMQVDARGDLAGGMTGKLVFKVAGLDGNTHSFDAALKIDRRLRTLLEGALALRHTTHPLMEADQDDYELGDQRTSVHRFATDAPRAISGFVATKDIDSPVAGELVILINVGAADLILENQSERSLAQDRIVTGTGASLTLRPDQTATLFYDQTSARWRVLATTGA